MDLVIDLPPVVAIPGIPINQEIDVLFLVVLISRRGHSNGLEETIRRHVGTGGVVDEVAEVVGTLPGREHLVLIRDTDLQLLDVVVQTVVLLR